MQLGEEERRQRVIESAKRLLHTEEEPIYHEASWISSQHIPTCVAFSTCNVVAQHGFAHRHSLGNIHFAGTESSLVWGGYMEGGLRAGAASACRVLQSLGKPEPQPILRERLYVRKWIAIACVLSLAIAARFLAHE
jgi:monoamine oxidase